MPDAKDPGSLTLTEAEQRLLDSSSNTDRQLQLQTLIETQERSPVATTPQARLQQATIDLEIAGLQLDLGEPDNAWQRAHDTISIFIEQQHFEDAALAGQYIYLCDKDDAISAIGQAAWLAVTYPVDPHLTVNILDHIVDETPDKSDGAAVVAATAHYVVDIRANEINRQQLELASGSMLARVARRHSNIESQEKFEQWVKILELDAPEKFLVRLRNVIDVMVQDTWWFDRDQLISEIPDAADNVDADNTDTGNAT